MRFLLIFSLLALAACSEPTIPKDKSISKSVETPKKKYFQSFENEDLPPWFYIFEDPETGCQYIVYSSFYKGGIAPRMYRDVSGEIKQICKDNS